MSRSRNFYYFTANIFLGLNFLVNFINIILLANAKAIFGNIEIVSLVTTVCSVPVNTAFMLVIMFFVYKVFSEPQTRQTQTNTPCKDSEKVQEKRQEIDV